MPPRLSPFRSARSLPLRPRTNGPSPVWLRAAPRRYITADDKPLPTHDEKNKPGPNQEQLPHVSEEAAAVGEITGEGGPELQQGTPVQEVLNRDKEGRENAPQVLKGQPKNSKPSGTRSYSTSARRAQQQQEEGQLIRYEDEEALDPGHKFGLPTLPIGPRDNIKFRYDPIVKQFTNLMMKDGELSKAQSNMARILNHLRTSPPPRVDPSKPLLPGAPPAQHLPLNPILYLQLAIDSVAPLLRMRSAKGIAGGGASLQIPEPLSLRQRRRTAAMWILDTAAKKPSRTSGRGMFAQRVADEIVSVVEGRSSVWEKRNGIHRLGTAARSNVGRRPMTKRK